MKPERQTRVLIGLLGVWIAILVLLNVWHPTVAGAPLRAAELTRPLSQLLPAERARFFGWLGVDTAFAFLYTVLYTSVLRVWASRSGKAWLDFLGRSLSWVTAVAILFDLTENAILWTQASTAATVISPWLPALVKLKWLSTLVVVVYGALWLVFRVRAKPASP